MPLKIDCINRGQKNHLTSEGCFLEGFTFLQAQLISDSNKLILKPKVTSLSSLQTALMWKGLLFPFPTES